MGRQRLGAFREHGAQPGRRPRVFFSSEVVWGPFRPTKGVLAARPPLCPSVTEERTGRCLRYKPPRPPLVGSLFSAVADSPAAGAFPASPNPALPSQCWRHLTPGQNFRVPLPLQLANYSPDQTQCTA